MGSIRINVDLAVHPANGRFRPEHRFVSTLTGGTTNERTQSNGIILSDVDTGRHSFRTIGRRRVRWRVFQNGDDPDDDIEYASE